MTKRSLGTWMIALAALAAALWWRSAAPMPAVAPAEQSAQPADAYAASRPAADSGTAPRSAMPDTTSPTLPEPRLELTGRFLREGLPCPDLLLAARSRDASGQPRPVVAQARTDATGRFVLAPLASGPYRLELTGGDAPAGLWFDVRVSGEDGFDLGEVELPRPASLHGRVVDETGNPLAGVRVWHCRDEMLGSDRFRLDVVDPAAPEADPSVVTGVDGRFRWDQQSPGRHHVRAELPGRVPRTDDVELAAGGTADLGDLVLLPGRELRGRVLDAKGQPIAGALVVPVANDLRRAARSGGDGSFLLRGVARGGELHVEAAGFQPGKVFVSAAASLEVRLQPTCTLTGTVRGADGAPTTVTLDWHFSQSTPEWMYGRKGPHPVAADATFRVEGLAPGTFTVAAQGANTGRSRAATVQLPQQAPVELRIEPDLAVFVSVRNELGAPVAGAEVGLLVATEEYWDPGPDLAHRVRNAWGSVRVRGDDQGQATVRGPGWERLAVFATHAEHLPEATLLLPGAESRVQLTLQHGGRVTGRLRDPGLAAAVRLWAQLEPLAPTEADRRSLAGTTTNCDLDARGLFHSPLLRPGNYRVTLCQYDASSSFDTAPARAHRVPLLARREATGSSTMVEVVAGATTRVELEAPGHGVLEGEVLARGQPLPGVWVFARTTPGDRHERVRDPDASDGHELDPHTRTDAQGHFRFLIGSAGSWELRARHPDMPAATGAVPVTVADPRAEQHVTLTLGGVEVRARFDHTRIPVPDREWCVAYLFRAAEAHQDLFHFSLQGGSPTWRRRSEPVGQGGSLRFAFVPAGRWVLCIVNRRDQLVIQRVLDVPEAGVLDLGTLQPEPTVDGEVRCGSSEVDAVWVRLRDPGNPVGVFVRTVRVENGRIPLPALAPGRYLVQGFRRHEYDHHSIGMSGEPIGEPAAIEVRADGSVTPETVFAK